MPGKLQLRKVKSHQELEKLWGMELWVAVGNTFTDLAAKSALKMILLSYLILKMKLLVLRTNRKHPCTFFRDSYLTCLPPNGSSSSRPIWA